MPRGDRRNDRNDDDGGGQNRNHYWSCYDTNRTLNIVFEQPRQQGG